MSFSNTYQNTRPPKEYPCTGCVKEKQCNETDKICLRRLRWWDAQMEKIRRKLNSET